MNAEGYRLEGYRLEVCVESFIIVVIVVIVVILVLQEMKTFEPPSAHVRRLVGGCFRGVGSRDVLTSGG